MTANKKVDRTLLLSDEILLVIFELLPLESRARAGRVCQRWRRVSRDQRLWKHVRLQLQLDAQAVTEDCSNASLLRVTCVLLAAPRIKALAVWTTPPVDSMAKKRMMQVVNASNCKFEEFEEVINPMICAPSWGCNKNKQPWFYKLLAQQSRSLLKLRIGIGFADMRIVPIMESMENLRHLSIESSHVSIHVPSKKSKLKHLLSFRMEGEKTGESRLLNTLLEHNSASLEDVSLRIDHRSTLEILTRCQNLKKLEIVNVLVDGHENFLLDLEELPALSDLILTQACEVYYNGGTPYSRFLGFNNSHLGFLPKQISFLKLSIPHFHEDLEPLFKRLSDLSNLKQVEVHGISGNTAVQNTFERLGPPHIKYIFT